MYKIVVLSLLFSLIHGQNFPNNYINVTSEIISTVNNAVDMDNLEYICDTFGPRYRYDLVMITTYDTEELQDLQTLLVGLSTKCKHKDYKTSKLKL